jgi:hypothetical protein
MPLTRRLMILLCGAIISGCQSPKPPLPKAVSAEEQVQVDYPDKGTIRFQGALKPHADGKGFTWKVPGSVRFHVSVPWNEEAPKEVVVKLECELSGKKTSLGSQIVNPIVKDGNMEFDAEMNIVAPWKPAGLTNVVVSKVHDQKEIASLPTPIKFSE